MANMKCHVCDSVLSNDPRDENFGLWTSTEPRWAYCAPLMMCPGCGCGWQRRYETCPECHSPLREAEDEDLSTFCARVTLRDHLAGGL